jgi:hypothetical protein
MKRILCLATVLGLAAAAEMSLTVAQLISFIHSAVERKTPDKQVAEYLKHVRMAEKLDNRTIEDLQSQGAGPKSVAALKELSAASASLSTAASTAPPKAAYVQPPPPDVVEQGKIIDEAREYVKNYTKNLPNFICVQVTRRDVAPSGSGTSWRREDTITTKLSYNQGREDYQVVLVNNTTPPPGTTMDKLGGTNSAGEFGSMMRDIFDRDSNARFNWDHWGKLRGRPAYVFAYDIEQRSSRFHVIAEKLDIVTAYRGLVYIDRDTKMVTKYTEIPYDIPEAFPVHNVELSLDYDFTKIGDSEFLLPLKSVNSSKSTRQLSRNEIEFRLYRKFGTESTITFETPDPLPEDKTKEKDEKPSKKQ